MHRVLYANAPVMSPDKTKLLLNCVLSQLQRLLLKYIITLQIGEYAKNYINVIIIINFYQNTFYG